MKKMTRFSTKGIWAIALFFLCANAPGAFAKPQQKPTKSGQENVDSLVDAAMKNMETGVWSVKGTVKSAKTIKIQGLSPATILT